MPKAPLRAADGRITGMLGIARGITERKAAGAALTELNAALEQQVQQRTAGAATGERASMPS